MSRVLSCSYTSRVRNACPIKPRMLRRLVIASPFQCSVVRSRRQDLTSSTSGKNRVSRLTATSTPSADQFIFGVAPLDYGPELLRMPFGFRLTADILPSGNCKWWLQVRVGCVRLSSLCPFRLLHTFLSPGQRGVIPAFGYGAVQRRVGLVDPSGPIRMASLPPQSLVQDRCITLYSTPNRDVIHRQTGLHHHFSQVAAAEASSANTSRRT